MSYSEKGRLVQAPVRRFGGCSRACAANRAVSSALKKKSGRNFLQFGWYHGAASSHIKGGTVFVCNKVIFVFALTRKPAERLKPNCILVFFSF